MKGRCRMSVFQWRALWGHSASSSPMNLLLSQTNKGLYSSSDFVFKLSLQIIFKILLQIIFKILLQIIFKILLQIRFKILRQVMFKILL